MAIDGAASVHQAVDASELDWLTISPRDGVGGGGPRPRKLRLASARTDQARAKLTCTVMIPAMLGRIWRNSRRAREKPSTWPARTYPACRRASAGPRTTRTNIGM